jgi:hypothetical protein
VQAPSILLQRVFSGKGYFLKIQAGGGYHFGYATEKLSIYGSETQSTAQGIGLLGEVCGQTAFDENLFGYISGVFGWEELGQLKDSKGNVIKNLTYSAALNYFHFGARFGVIYYW